MRPSHSVCLILLVLVGACSRDPAKQKAAFFGTGSNYMAAGKYQEAVIQFRQAYSELATTVDWIPTTRTTFFISARKIRRRAEGGRKGIFGRPTECKSACGAG